MDPYGQAETLGIEMDKLYIVIYKYIIYRPTFSCVWLLSFFDTPTHIASTLRPPILP